MGDSTTTSIRSDHVIDKSISSFNPQMDILCDRHPKAYNSPPNQYARSIVQDHRSEYLQCRQWRSQSGIGRVIDKVMEEILGQGGRRFFKRILSNNNEERRGSLMLMTTKEIRDRVSHWMRDCHPSQERGQSVVSTPVSYSRKSMMKKKKNETKMNTKTQRRAKPRSVNKNKAKVSSSMNQKDPSSLEMHPIHPQKTLVSTNKNTNKKQEHPTSPRVRGQPDQTPSTTPTRMFMTSDMDKAKRIDHPDKNLIRFELRSEKKEKNRRISMDSKRGHDVLARNMKSADVAAPIQVNHYHHHHHTLDRCHGSAAATDSMIGVDIRIDDEDDQLFSPHESHHHNKGTGSILESLPEQQRKLTAKDLDFDLFQPMHIEASAGEKKKMMMMSQQDYSIAEQYRTTGATSISRKLKQQDHAQGSTLVVPAAATTTTTMNEESIPVWPWIMNGLPQSPWPWIIDKDGFPQPPPPPPVIDRNFWMLMDRNIISHSVNNGTDDDDTDRKAHVQGGLATIVTMPEASHTKLSYVDAANHKVFKERTKSSNKVDAAHCWKAGTDGNNKAAKDSSSSSCRLRPFVPPADDAIFVDDDDDDVAIATVAAKEQLKDNTEIQIEVVADDDFLHHNGKRMHHQLDSNGDNDHHHHGPSSLFSESITIDSQDSPGDRMDIIDLYCFTSSTSWIDDL